MQYKGFGYIKKRSKASVFAAATRCNRFFAHKAGLNMDNEKD